ncbi:hypothetical protein [Bradyrhizobium cenepequi]
MPYPRDPGWKVSGTAQDAAEAISNHAETVRGRVLAFLTERHPASFTADEVADRLGVSILSTRPRITELLRGNLIEPTEERCKNRSGMLAKCWRAKRAAQ